MAIKILSPTVADDADRLARFEREAQALAALNHPHIAQIYGVEDVPAAAGSGSRALVMEYVDGEGLDSRIARGPVPLDEALDIARQMAEALDAAHTAGIVHRDLKPANVRVTPDGKVKVLDFGLAKAIEQAGGHASADLLNSPTITSPATQAGVILGTACYMSPEQARGKAVDKRADIWAFGCVLFELLTGQRAFEGHTVTDVLSSIVRDEPKWAALPPDTSGSVRNLLARCLTKDPAKRLRDIGDAALDPAGLAQQARSGRPGGRTWLPWIVAAAALAGWVVLGILLARRTLDPPSAVQFTIPDSEEMQWDAAPDSIAPFPELSPDGKHLALIGNAGGRSLWVRSLGSLASRRVVTMPGANRPFWSPDGRSIGFFAAGKLMRVDLDGSVVQPLCDLPSGVTQAGNGGTWSSNGSILFSSTGRLFTVAGTGGGVTALGVSSDGKPVSNIRSPSFLPDGDRFLFASNGAIYLARLTAPAARELLRADSKAVYSARSLLFVRNRMLQAQPVDPDTGELSGAPQPILPFHVRAFLNETALTASENGVLVLRSGSIEETSLVWWDRNGTRQGAVGPSGTEYVNPTLSPDHSRVATALRTGTDKYDIWMLDAEKGTPSRFTFAVDDELLPHWSPDGQFIAYSGGPAGNQRTFRRRANGAGAEEVLLFDFLILSDWSADGQRLWGRSGEELLYVRPEPGAQPLVYLKRQFNEDRANESPDGKWIAYNATESGRNEVYIRPFPDANAGKWQVSYDGGLEPRWRADGKELYYLHPTTATMRELRAVAIQLTADGPKIGDAQTLFQASWAGGNTSYDVSRDGKRFLVNMRTGARTDQPLTVVINWPSLLPKSENPR